MFEHCLMVHASIRKEDSSIKIYFNCRGLTQELLEENIINVCSRNHFLMFS